VGGGYVRAVPKPQADAVTALLEEVTHQEQPQPAGGKADLKGKGAIVTGAATGIIAGLGFQSYVLALHAIALLARVGDPPEPPGAHPMAESAIMSGAQDAHGES